MSERREPTGYSIEDARRVVAGGEGGRACVIDLRGEEDFAEAHIPSALRVEEPRADDVEAVGRGSQEVELVLLVCDDGQRSEQLARELAGKGREIGWLDGGMKAWLSNGSPVQPRPDVEFEGPKKLSLY